MKALILDTSSILFAASNKIDIFEVARYSFPGCSLEVSDGIIAELKGMRGSTRKEKVYAGIALKMLDKSGIEVYKDNGKVDIWIVKRAQQSGAAVCTNDVNLKRYLKRSKVKVFSISRDGRIK